MEWIYDDGGRAEAGYKGHTGDCCCRAIAIVTGMPYKTVYDMINEYAKHERMTKKVKARGRSNARTGVWKDTAKKIMLDFGWTWVPTMQIGSGCQVHLDADELPKGKIMCLVSKHYVAIIDGVAHDTYDSTRESKRCVYGYFTKEEVN